MFFANAIHVDFKFHTWSRREGGKKEGNLIRISLTFIRYPIWQQEGRPSGRNGVLGICPSRLEHAVHGRYSVADFEARNGGAERVDGAGDVVAGVEGEVEGFEVGPVFDVAACDDDFDDEVVGGGGGDWDGVDGGVEGWGWVDD